MISHVGPAADEVARRPPDPPTTESVGTRRGAALTRTEFRLLVELALQHGKVCGRKHLLDPAVGVTVTRISCAGLR
jgi:hypothetical protein